MKRMLNAYNELIEHINFLNAENEKIMSAIATLENLEPCDNVNTAIDALKAEYKLNNDFIIEYTMQANDYDELIENSYDETRNYKEELKQDAINTYKTLVDTNISGLANGYSHETFMRRNAENIEYLTRALETIDVLESNFSAFAYMINRGIGSL